jgi:hypothetical protein
MHADTVDLLPHLPLVHAGAFPVFVPFFPETCFNVSGPTSNSALNCILALQPGNPAALALGSFFGK